MHVSFITGTRKVITEAENLKAISSVHQLDNCSFEVTTVHCVIDDAASDDRAERAAVGDYYLHNGRRSFVISQTNKPCKYIYV